MEIPALVCKSATIFQEKRTDRRVIRNDNSVDFVSRALHLVSSRFVQLDGKQFTASAVAASVAAATLLFVICLVVNLTQAFMLWKEPIHRLLPPYFTDACTIIVWLHHRVMQSWWFHQMSLYDTITINGTIGTISNFR